MKNTDPNTDPVADKAAAEKAAAEKAAADKAAKDKAAKNQSKATTHAEHVAKVRAAAEKSEKEAREAENKERADQLLRQTGNTSYEPAEIVARMKGKKTKGTTESGNE